MAVGQIYLAIDPFDRRWPPWTIIRGMGVPLDLSLDDLTGLLDGEPPYRAGQVWRALHQGLEPAEMTDLPAALRGRLAAAMPSSLDLAATSVSGGADTVKWLWSMADGSTMETVLMQYPGRATVCVSSQAGCAMACTFCATGQAGFRRHLTAGEIVEQVVRARRAALPRRLSNVVFMGMGEPLANYDATWSAVERLHHDLGLSARHLTISTVGIVPGILRLAEERLPVNLAVSLHAANDDLRADLVPISRRWPLPVLMDACRTWRQAKNRRLSFEWALIDAVNDRDTDVDELAALAIPLAAHVNLIPLNPTPGYLTRGTAPARIRAFRDRLRARGVNATVRRNRGTDIDAACGQLAALN
ncbi:MAG: 23S rRNA (adenine(2503)-C(2))-methyltransferase RlmN, partial [Actinomycetota bacterium]|nr:23S rRNA (adenine(2503)-C(2))-methyltransferase RlmN [Actinomycetota bacterium]